MAAPVPVQPLSVDGGVKTPTSASSGNQANAAAVATIAAAAGVTNWASGFMLTASGSTAALVVNATLTGLTGGTMTFTFTFPAGAAVAATPVVVAFPEPIPATATNVALVLTLPAGGLGNTNAAAVLFGFTSKASIVAGT